MDIQTSNKNHFTEGIIYASETTKIVDENHSLQQAFLNELEEKLKGVLQRIGGYAVNEDTLRELISLSLIPTLLALITTHMTYNVM